MEFVIFVIVVAVIAFFVRNKDNKKTTANISIDRNNDNVVSKSELKKLTKNQLLEMADKKSLKVKRSGSKADVINEIHSQLK